MNLFKSAFSSSKNDQTNKQLNQLYEDVKSWDGVRANSLRNHLKIVEKVMDALDRKVVQVEKYIEGLQKLMASRIDEITIYCRNGVNDSEFFLVPCPLQSMKPCHQLLKHLLMEESQRELNLSRKGTILSNILERLKKLKGEECTQKSEEIQREGDHVRQLKSNIRFLIDCELSDLNGDVLASCKEVSLTHSQNKDFYWAIERFARMAERQLKMHQEIGKQLVELVHTFSQREKKLRTELRDILSDWVKEDLDDKIFVEQLHKERPDELIDDFYDIENLIADQSELWKGSSITEYLQNLHILPFNLHRRLIQYDRQLLYNSTIEARMIITEQKYVYLFRLLAIQPDFLFLLGKNIRISIKSPLSVHLQQIKRTMLLREQTQFQFLLQFNLETDQQQFVQKCSSFGCLVQKR